MNRALQEVYYVKVIIDVMYETDNIVRILLPCFRSASNFQSLLYFFEIAVAAIARTVLEELIYLIRITD